jgi:cytidine deaminase
MSPSTVTFDSENDPKQQPDRSAELEHLAETACHHSYAPYSRFHVGAAILLESGEVVTGCNVENASYRLTTCAEQNAIAAAVAKFGPKIRIQAVAVANLAKTPCQPCGACRQTIAEFASRDAVITFPGEGGVLVRSTLAELLPAAFELKSS